MSVRRKHVISLPEVCRRRFYRLRHDTVILSITKLITKGHDNVGSKTRSKDKRTSYQSYRDNDVSLFSRGRDGLMSLASPSDGRERSGSGETQARPKATGLMIEKHALVHYLNENLFIWRKVAGASKKGKAVGPNLIMNILLSFAGNKL